VRRPVYQEEKRVKRGSEIYNAICESLTQSPKFSVACRKVGISEKTLYQWLGKSQQGDPSFVFDYLDAATPLHVAVKQAQARYVIAFVQDSEHDARFGTYKQTYFKGQPCWQQDPKFLSWTDDQLQQLGLDRYLRDENGELVPVMEWHPPSAQLRLAALAARQPKLYGTKITHDVNQRVNLGVHVVPTQPKPLPPAVEVLRPSLAAPEIEPSDFTELPPGAFEEEPEPETDIGLDDDYRSIEPDEVEQPELPSATGLGPNPAIDRRPTELRRHFEALAAKLPKVEPEAEPVASPPANPHVCRAPTELRLELERLAAARAGR
jgi:hypothetical protein